MECLGLGSVKSAIFPVFSWKFRHFGMESLGFGSLKMARFLYFAGLLRHLGDGTSGFHASLLHEARADESEATPTAT